MDTVRFYLKDNDPETLERVGKTNCKIGYDAFGCFVTVRGCFRTMGIPEAFQDDIAKVTFTHSRIDAMPMRAAGVYVHKSARAVVETEAQNSMWHIRMLEAEHLKDAQELYGLICEGKIKPTGLDVEQIILQPGITVLSDSIIVDDEDEPDNRKGESDSESPLVDRLSQQLPDFDINTDEFDTVVSYAGYSQYSRNHISTDAVVVLSVTKKTDFSMFFFGFSRLAEWTRRNGQSLLVVMETNGEAFPGKIFGHKTDASMVAACNITISVSFKAFSHVKFFTDFKDAASMIDDIASKLKVSVA